MYFTLLMNFVILILHSERSDILHSSFIYLCDSYRITYPKSLLAAVLQIKILSTYQSKLCSSRVFFSVTRIGFKPITF